MTSALTWPVLAGIDPSDRATVSAIWYGALLLALGSIATAAQQAVALSRLSSHPEGLRQIREVLGRRKVDGRWRPSKVQLVVWQTPVSMLNASIVMFVVGFGVLVWASVEWGWAWDDVKVFFVSGFFGGRGADADFSCAGCDGFYGDVAVYCGSLFGDCFWLVSQDCTDIGCWLVGQAESYPVLSVRSNGRLDDTGL